MDLIYVPAKESDVEPLFQMSKDLIDRYENITYLYFSR